MYLSNQEMTASRSAILSNLHQTSMAYLGATEQLIQACFASARQLLAQDQYREMWWSGLPRATSNLFQAACSALGHAQQAFIVAADQHHQIIDSAVQTTLNRVGRMTPPEGMGALVLTQQWLKGTDEAVHTFSEQAVEAVEKLEHLVGEVPSKSSVNRAGNKIKTI